MAVHAHPDDESITTGGLLARSSAAGVLTSLITCSDGRYGPVNPELGLTLTPSELAELRKEELSAAASELGVVDLNWLGFHDSGMTGSPNNQAPEAFWAQPQDIVLDVMVGLLRRLRPHVLVTYDPFGCTGHPDHIQAHRAALLAIEAAGETSAFPHRGPAWSVEQVFYPVFPQSAMDQFIAEDLGAGLPHPFDGRAASEINYVRSDAVVTHRVDIRDVYDRKRMALGAHQTQVGPHYPMLYRAALARREYEHFRRAVDRTHSVDFSDVFESVTEGHS